MTYRLLHCSDLHLGQRFHDQDRSGDEQHALDQVVALCRERAIDGVVLAGDIFDTANPGAQEVKRYNRFLANLVLDEGVGTVVVIAGNHDNGTRIEGPRELYEQCRIHAVGALHLNDPVDQCLITMANRAGEPALTCAAVPFLRDGDVRQIGSGESVSEAAAAHRQAVSERLKAIRAAAPTNLPLMVAGHAYLSGGALTDERPVQVGNQGHIPAEAFAGDCAYLAMGHLHRPQAIAGNERWRYCGSLLPTGFDEIDTARSVNVVTIESRDNVSVEQVPLEPYRTYRQIRGTDAQVIPQIRDLAPAQKGAPAPWIKVTVEGATSGPRLARHLTELALAKGWRLLDVHIHTKPVSMAGGSENDSHETPPENILDDPSKVFERLLNQKGVVEESRKELQQAFDHLRERYIDILESEGIS